MTDELISQKTQFARDMADQIAYFMEAYKRLEHLVQRYVDLDLTGTFIQDDFVGDVVHVTPAKIADAVAAVNAIKDTLELGHRAALNRVRR